VRLGSTSQRFAHREHGHGKVAHHAFVAARTLEPVDDVEQSLEPRASQSSESNGDSNAVRLRRPD